MGSTDNFEKLRSFWEECSREVRKPGKHGSSKNIRISKEDKVAENDTGELKRIKKSIKSVQNDEWAGSHFVHVRCEPMIEILSVRLRNENNSLSHVRKEPWKLDGEIYVHDGQGNDKCFVYERDADSDEPEIIPLPGGVLSLTGPDDITPIDKPHISMCIRDRVSGVAIVDGSAALSTTIDSDQQNHHFEQFHTTVVPGTVCSAVVEYLALTFGVFACVEVKLFRQQVAGGGSNKLEEGKGLEQELDVYGTISADYNLYYSKNKVNHIKLFEIMEDSDESESVTLGSPITLSRSVVAVPGYSSLRIRVSLVDRASNKLIVQDGCDFDSHNYCGSRQIISGPSGFDAQVNVDWMEVTTDCRDPFMLSRLQASSLVLGGPTRIMPNPLKIYAYRSVEVFSIFIGRQNDEQLSLHGMVNFYGFHGYSTIFKRDKSNPYILSSGCNLLPLEGPQDALKPADTFFMAVDLEDVEGRVSIKGFVKSSVQINQRDESWYGRLLCSVVKGAYERSFAAVNYTVFLRAYKAKLKVFMPPKDDSPDAYRRIYGSLVACYGNYGYKTRYEKLYHQSVLFERPEENPVVMPHKDFSMGLLRSVVVVPYDSTLQIVANLSCWLSTTGFTGVLRKTTEIQIGQEIVDFQVDGVHITIAVKWSEI